MAGIEKWLDPLYYTELPYLVYKEARLDEAVECAFDPTLKTRIRIYEESTKEPKEGWERCAICQRLYPISTMDKCELNGIPYYLCKKDDSKEVNHDPFKKEEI